MFQDRLHALLVPALQAAFQQLFQHAVDPAAVVFQSTRPEFEGDVTINVFPFLKVSGKGPEPTATAIGEYLQANVEVVERFNVVKGFLNVVIADRYWLGFLREAGERDILQFPATGEKVMVEYSSPNTNKPLHLGHLRNNFLGHSVSRILQAAGNEVVRVQIINDRGIHICKSMVAWLKFGNGETPESSGLKGDKLVGKYYVLYDKWAKDCNRALLKEVLAVLGKLRVSEHGMNNGVFELMARLPIWSELASADIKSDVSIDEAELARTKNEFEKDSVAWFNLLLLELRVLIPSNQPDSGATRIIDSAKAVLEEGITKLPISLAQEMLRKWEANDPDVRALWEKMNGWVYDGFNATYAAMGVEFDKLYYESETYLLGKQDVLDGVEKGIFFRKPDGSVWVDLTADGLDEKILLRGDGTSVYMTQDVGTAIRRFEEFPGLQRLIYTVGNEQDYHFKVLFLVLKKLGYAWADGLYHLSYGMVDLPSGKMKSREGTVVDADDLIAEVIADAGKATGELGKLDEFTAGEKTGLFRMIGLAALKYFLLKVDPKKRMLFDPAASIDLQGHTGPFIQYTYARIKSLLRKAGLSVAGSQLSGVEATVTSGQLATNNYRLLQEERNVIKLLHQFPAVLNEAAMKLDPSSLANHTYELVKTYNGFYQSVPVLKEEDSAKRGFRLSLSATVGDSVKKAMWCLGIEVPERM